MHSREAGSASDREAHRTGLLESQRKACAVATCNRKTFRRMLRCTDDAALLQRLHELAAERRRLGYRRLDVLLRRDGIVANHKQIYRVYAEANHPRRDGIAGLERSAEHCVNVGHTRWKFRRLETDQERERSRLA